MHLHPVLWRRYSILRAIIDYPLISLVDRLFSVDSLGTLVVLLLLLLLWLLAILVWYLRSWFALDELPSESEGISILINGFFTHITFRSQLVWLDVILLMIEVLVITGIQATIVLNTWRSILSDVLSSGYVFKLGISCWAYRAVKFPLLNCVRWRKLIVLHIWCFKFIYNYFR